MDNNHSQSHGIGGHQGIAITMEKDTLANTRSRRDRFAVQRALGFKNVVIYILVFLNMVLCTKLWSTYSRGSPSSSTPADTFQTLSGHKPEVPEHEGEDATSIDFWIKMALIVGLVMIGGVFAGLTIGLMGLDETNLHVLMASGSPQEQIHAETVFKLLSRGKHWVLVTLLLGNVIVNETLPVVLDSELGGGVVAILISTLLIVVFGEIIPQAVCARYGLAIGSYCAKPMLVFMYIMSPVAYPIAMLLDSWLGVHHGTTYRRTELKTLVSLHQVDGIGELTDDEVTIIASVLDLKEKPVSMVMTPLEDVFTLSEDAILDEQLMEEIVSAGYSRIPIYRHDDPNNFIGMLLVKRLITYDPEDHIAVRQFTINSLPEAAPNTSCLDILNFFQEGRSHMAIVTSEPGGFGYPVGVITLEDVIEELLGEEIVDESDVYVDIHNKIRVIRKPTRNVNMIKNLKTLLRSPALSDATTPLLGGNATLDKRALTLPAETNNSYMATGKTILQSRKSSAAALMDPAVKLDDGPDHDCAFRTGSLPKDNHAQLKHHEPHLEAPVHPHHPTEASEATVANMPEDVADLFSSQVPADVGLLAQIAEAQAEAAAEVRAEEEAETVVSRALAPSGSTATILTPGAIDNVASPASSSSKKKKKKKKSNK